MAHSKIPASEHEKERMRAEIDRQIADFLNRGGKIDVLGDEQQRRDGGGSVWHQQDEMSNLVP
jgi:hypothetical protein